MRADTRRRWLWAAVLLVAFAVGVVAGGYAANLRATPTQHVADLAAMIALEDGEPAPVGETAGERLSLSLYNMSDSAVTVSEMRPLGWTVETDTELTVPPMQWTPVPLSIAPDCDAEPAGQVRLRVHGDGTDEQVTLRVRDGASLAEMRHLELCTRPAPSRLIVEDVETRRHDGELEMRLSLQLQGAPDASRTLSYPSSVGVSGLRVEITTSSETVRPGETATVTMRWTVDECLRTDEFALAGAPLLTAVGEAVGIPLLPDRAAAALARFSAEECAASNVE